MGDGKRLWHLARRYWFDVLVVVGIGVGIAGAVVHRHHAAGPEGPLWFDVLAVLGFTVPLLFRRRFPFGAPVALAVFVAASSFVDGRVVTDNIVGFFAGLAVCVLFGMRPVRAQAVVGLACAIGAAAIVTYNDPSGKVGDLVWDIITFSVAWIVGFAVGGKFREADEARERAARAEREREERARLAVAEERARVARELHDVVGHSVSVMTVQASAVRRLLSEDQEKVREALLTVEQTGREALAEMRRMVGVLRHVEEAPARAPQPSLEQLERLVENARETGLPVELRIEGEPAQLPAGVDLTAYRLVQEGLTNAVKHAGAAHAEVVVRYGDGHVELTVSDDGSGGGDGGRSGPGSGHGLVGMRERVAVYGGELEAGPRPEGGYRLRARLPVA
jgi:signal transduction histidine kinase